MVILGLDPGIARTGFGVIDTSRSNPFVRCGCLTTPEDANLEDRLVLLGNDLASLLDTVHPDHAVVEHIFFGTNRKTATLTAHARGVLLYILTTRHIPTESLTPLQIKSRLTGYGAADKHQVRTLVQQRLKLSALPSPDDAADALAAALCAADLFIRQQRV